MTTFTPAAWSSSTACAGDLADLVLEADRSDDLPVADDVQDRRAPPLQASVRSRELRWDGQLTLPQQGRATDGHGRAVDVGFDAAARHRPEPGRRRQAADPFAGVGVDRPGQRVLRVGLDRTGDGEQLGLVEPDGRRDVGDDVLAAGEGAGLVEQHGVHGADLLQRETVLDEHARAADFEVEIAVTSGIASPSAWGQAMISTVTVRSSAKAADRAGPTRSR
jgi:hypothetical protein